MRDYGEDNRVPPSSDGTKEGFRSVLAEASDVSYRTFESIQAVAGTTACKGVQINALRKFAVENHCWIADISALGEFVDRGSENEVYSAYDADIVYKLNDFRYADALPNNVLYGTDGHLYFIDTIIYTTQSESLKTYRTLSPRFSKSAE